MAISTNRVRGSHGRTVLLLVASLMIPFVIISTGLVYENVESLAVEKSAFMDTWTGFLADISWDAAEALDDSLYINDEFASYLYRLPYLSDDLNSIMLLDPQLRPIFLTGDQVENDSLLRRVALRALTGFSETLSGQETGRDYAVFSSPVVRNGKIPAALVITVEGIPDEFDLESLASEIATTALPVSIPWSLILAIGVYFARRRAMVRRRFDSAEMILSSMDLETQNLNGLSKSTLKELVLALNLGDAAIYLRNRGTGEIELLRRYPSGNNGSLADEAVFEPGDPRLRALADKKPKIYVRTRSGRTQIVEKVDRSSESIRLAIPLSAGFRSIGILDIGFKRRRNLNPRMMRICERLSRRIAASMDRMVNYGAAVRQAFELNLLLESVEIIDSSSSLVLAMGELSRKITQLDAVSFCRVFLMDESGKNLVLTAETFVGEGMPTKTMSKSYDIEDLPIHKIAILSDQSQFLKGEEIDRLLLEKRDLYQPGVKDYVALIIPLANRERRLGCLSIGVEGRSDFPMDMKDFLENLAHHVSSSIYQVQLYSRLKKSFDKLMAAQGREIQLERLRAVAHISEGISEGLEKMLRSIKNEVKKLEGLSVGYEVGAAIRSLKAAIFDSEAIMGRFRGFAGMGRDRRFQQVELARIVRDAERKLNEEWSQHDESRRNLNLTTNVSGSGQIYGDPIALGEMIGCIVTNCVEAMPEGGVVAIESSVDQNLAVLEISDQGVGMTSDVKGRIFEPFFTTKEGNGRGLGMSLAYGIVSAHNGTIEVESEPERGSRFTIRIPLIDPDQTSLHKVDRESTRRIAIRSRD
jgi:signal transduction histidine kinase